MGDIEKSDKLVMVADKSRGGGNEASGQVGNGDGQERGRK